MANNLVAPTNLTGFDGAPFSSDKVDAAVGAIRGEAGWHIAPEVTETLRVESWGGRWLHLPTRRVVAVTNVQQNGVTLSWALYPGSSLYRVNGWPVGVVEVALTHGYEECPPELYAVIAEATTGGRVRSRQEGPWQTSYAANGHDILDASAALSRYALHPGV